MHPTVFEAKPQTYHNRANQPREISSVFCFPTTKATTSNREVRSYMKHARQPSISYAAPNAPTFCPFRHLVAGHPGDMAPPTDLTCMGRVFADSRSRPVQRSSSVSAWPATSDSRDRFDRWRSQWTATSCNRLQRNKRKLEPSPERKQESGLDFCTILSRRLSAEQHRKRQTATGSCANFPEPTLPAAGDREGGPARAAPGQEALG